MLSWELLEHSLMDAAKRRHCVFVLAAPLFLRPFSLFSYLNAQMRDLM